MIADGKIKLKSGVKVERIKKHSVVLSDGSELPADLIVYATGYGSMNGWAAALISQEVADKVGKCWGLGSNTTKDPGPWEGELRNMWKPTQQEALWFHGGNLHQSRHYSQYLSLQLKARMEGLPTPVYGLQKAHHVELSEGSWAGPSRRDCGAGHPRPIWPNRQIALCRAGRAAALQARLDASAVRRRLL